MVFYLQELLKDTIAFGKVPTMSILDIIFEIFNESRNYKGFVHV